MSQSVHTTIEDGIARITIDDGKVNALSPDLIAEIETALRSAEKAGAVAVLRGREGIFSAGFDLGTFARGTEAGLAMVRAGAELILRILALKVPVVTACTGHAYPAGAFLMMAADTRFAVRGDFRIGMNEVPIGMTVPRFAVELARHRLSPPGFARITTGPMFSPEEAQRLGYVDRIVEPEQLENAVCEEAERLSAIDFPAYIATKQRINAQAIDAIRSALEAELRELA